MIVTDELSKPEYRANPVNRCFHCKSSLYTYLDDMATSLNVSIVLNGTNLDDLGDHRPGLIAAENFEVRSPLVEMRLSQGGHQSAGARFRLGERRKTTGRMLIQPFPLWHPHHPSIACTS